MTLVTCDRTGKSIPLEEGFIVARPDTGEWSFLCADAPEKLGDYSIPIRKMVSSPEELIDWLAHLSEKAWFQEDKFFSLFKRLRNRPHLNVES